MLAQFFKSLYSVGIQLAPSKTFDWVSILSYFKVTNSINTIGTSIFSFWPWYYQVWLTTRPGNAGTIF